MNRIAEGTVILLSVSIYHFLFALHCDVFFCLFVFFLFFFPLPLQVGGSEEPSGDPAGLGHRNSDGSDGYNAAHQMGRCLITLGNLIWIWICLTGSCPLVVAFLTLDKINSILH